MAFSIEADPKKDFQIAIIFTDRLEREMAQLLVLRRRVSDAERAHDCFQAARARRTLRGARPHSRP
jgi:hypothetical protein